MNDHNLNDLIVDDMEPKSKNTKSILTLASLLIVVFIVTIVFTSLMLDDSDENATIEDNETEMRSPELTLQNTQKKQEDEDATLLNNIIENELNKPVEAPNAPEDNIKEETITPTQSSEETNKETPSVVEPKETKKVVKKPVSKPTPKKVVKKEAVTRGSFYIQTGSFSNAPSKRLISSIKNNGFKYTTYRKSGITKLLIGPYNSRASANRALPRVKDLIIKGAFIVQK